MDAVEGRCKGCGAELQPSRAPGKPRKWCSERCRKAQYGQACIDCGARTVFGRERERVDEPRCHPCSNEHRRKWTRETIVSRIQEWARLYGEPPAIPDWNPPQARHVNDEARARRFEEARGHWPFHNVVFAVFGSWNAAIAEAGFEPRDPTGTVANHARRRSVRAKRERESVR